MNQSYATLKHSEAPCKLGWVQIIILQEIIHVHFIGVFLSNFIKDWFWLASAYVKYLHPYVIQYINRSRDFADVVNFEFVFDVLERFLNFKMKHQNWSRHSSFQKKKEKKKGGE